MTEKPGLPGMDETVCDCLSVTAGDIAEAAGNGADTADAVCAATGAGAVCGRCRESVKALLDILEDA